MPPAKSAALANEWRLGNPLEQDGWDALVFTHPDATFFHGAAWARVLQETYSFSPCYFARSDGRTLDALVPLMEVDSLWTGRRGVGLPFTDHCALLGNEAAVRSGFERAIEHGRSRRWRYVEFRGRAAVFDDVPPSLSFFTHRLDLRAGPEAIEKRLTPAVRRAIRKARDAGLTAVRSDTLEAVRRYYRLHCLTRRRHGVPPQPFRFFEALQRHVLGRGLGFVMEAVAAGRAIASAVFLTCGKKAIYKYGASEAASQSLRGNNLVFWEAIRWLARNGFESLDFGRTSRTNEGLRRFKNGWGCEESTLDYFRYDLRQARFVTMQDKSYGWHNAVFGRAPIWFSRWVGALAYRHTA